jgi:photosystem II stability/assembly factor-like uncharacterized protein
VILWLLVFLFPLHLGAQWTLAACAAVSKDYVVGAKLPPSGLFLKSTDEWRHVGFNHPFIVAVDYDPTDPSTLYLAAGNGLFRAAKRGEQWTQLTGSDVTELRDLAIDPTDPKTIYFAHSQGLRVTHDRGATWTELAANLHRHYVETIRLDRTQPKRLIIGGEEGIFRSEDGGKSWTLAGASGFPILRIVQSPHDACFWLATSQGGGLFASRDCGKTFENSGRIGVNRDLYSVSFDPTNPHRIAIAGWGPGVAVSDDSGQTWQERNQGLPRPDVWSVIFDPSHPGRLYASVQEEALYVSDDAGVTWKRDGLEGSVARSLKFIP